jgi:hypothetical protein
MKIETLGDVWTFAIGAPATVDAVTRTLAAGGIDGATIVQATGVWQGQKENTVLVTVAGIDKARAFTTAETLRLSFEQQAVYVEHGGQAYLVSRPLTKKEADKKLADIIFPETV